QIERRSRRDRQEDLVSREVEARGIARVETSVALVEDRQFVRRMSGRVEEDEGVLPEIESITVFDRDQPVCWNRFHRPEDLRFFRPECLPRARHESGRIHEMFVTELMDV